MSEALESVRSYARAWPSMSVWAMTMPTQGQGCAECPTTPPGPCPMWLSPTSMWTPLPPTPCITATTSQWLVTTSPCWPLSPPTRCSVEKFTPSQGMKQSLIDVCEMVLIYCCPAGLIPVFLTLKRSMSSHSALATMTLTVMLTSTVIQVSCFIYLFKNKILSKFFMSRRGWYRDHPAAPWQDCDQWRHWTACELCVQHQQQCGVPGHGAGGGAAEQVPTSNQWHSSNLSENNHHAMFGNACHHKCLLPHSYLSCRKLLWKLYTPVIF